MLPFLKPAPDATEKVTKDQIPHHYKAWQVRTLVSACIVYIGYYIIRLIFTTEQNDIKAAYGFSLGQIGLIMSTFGIGYGCSKLVMGTLADRSNPNRYVATGLIVSSILNIFLGSTRSFALIALLMLLNAVMQGMGAASCHRIVTLWFGRKGQGSIMPRGTAFTIWSSAHNLGAFCCVALINLAGLLFGHSIAYAFYTASAVSIVIAIIVLFLGADRPTSKGLPTIEEYSEDRALVDEVGTAAEVTDMPIYKVFISYIFKNKLLGAAILASICVYAVRYGVLSWIPSYLTEFKGFDPGEAKWLVGIFELAAVPGVIILGFLTDLLKGRRGLILFLALLGMMASLTVYFFASNHIVIIVDLLILGNLIYAPMALLVLIGIESVPKFAVGAATGALGFGQYIVGETAATAGMGILVDHYGWQAGNIILYVAATIAILASFYIMIHQSRALATED